jgi:hypothetical protein
MPLQHTRVEDCVNAPTLTAIKLTLETFKSGISELTKSSSRTAEALEEIARQGAKVESHEKCLDRIDKKLDKHDEYFAEAFRLIRAIETVEAKETGKEEIIEKREAFHNQVKISMLPWAIGGIILLAWMIDHYNVIEFIARCAVTYKK